MFLLGFLGAAAFWPGIASAAYAPRWWVVLVAAPLLLACVPTVRWTVGHGLGTLFVWCGALSVVWSFQPVDTVHHTVLLLGLACAFGIGADGANMSAFWRGLAWGLVPSLPIAVMQMAGFNPVQSTGVDGLFLNRNVYSLVGAAVLIGMIGCMGWHSLARSKIDVFLCCVALFAMLAPGSRSTLLAAALVMGWIIAPRGRVLSILGMCISGAALLLWLDGFDGERYNSMLYRTQFWRLTLANLHWFGTGLGTYPEVWPYGSAHNEALEVVFELGILSLPLFALFIYAFKAPLGYERAVLATIVIASMFNAHLHAPTVALIAAVLLGRLCAARADVLCEQLDSRARYPGRLAAGIFAKSASDVRRA